MTTSTLRAATVLAVALACAACQPAARAPAPSNSGAPSPAGTTQSRATIPGEAVYRERIGLPAGTSLHVELVDAASAGVLASTVVAAATAPPFAFALEVDSRRIDPARPHALRARLIDAQGTQWFVTPQPVPVEPGGAPVRLLLQRTVDATPRDADAGNAFHWQCGDLGLMSRYGDDAVRLDANGMRWTLPVARSASGARYADGAGNEFWTKGSSGTLSLAGEPRRECTQAANPSPWNEALLRGIAFRAVGNEPGWYVEVGPGGSPPLHALLDYGERRLELPSVARRADGFDGTSGGESVSLRVQRGPCTDGMSGQRFEASAELRVGDRSYTGCGSFLDD